MHAFVRRCVPNYAAFFFSVIPFIPTMFATPRKSPAETLWHVAVTEAQTFKAIPVARNHGAPGKLYRDRMKAATIEHAAKNTYDTTRNVRNRATCAELCNLGMEASKLGWLPCHKAPVRVAHTISNPLNCRALAYMARSERLGRSIVSSRIIAFG